MKSILITCLLMFFSLPSHGQETPIRQLYEAILAHPSGEDVPEAKHIYHKVNEVKVRALPVAEVDAILPLAFQCIRSPKADVIEAGYAFLVSVMLRFDSAKLMEPYISALGKLADVKDNPRRQLALAILGGLLPRPPDEAIAYLEANLESSKNTTQERSFRRSYQKRVLVRVIPVCLGFSYRFRPGRSQHDALDALVVGISGQKVNFILNANIRRAWPNHWQAITMG